MTDSLFSGGFLPQAGDYFLAHGLGESVVRADLGAEAVVPLLSWDDLNAILSTGTLQPPRLRLYRQGSPVPVERYTQTATVGGERRAVVRPVDLYAQLRDGASLIIEAIDRLHPPIRAAADDLICLVREPVQANLYLLWGETHGFDAHWDDHDTVIVQVMGTKSWTVHGPGRTHPMRLDANPDHTCPDATVWEGVLEAGHALHVPRGWWHTVCGTGEVSLHLTFGFTRTTGIDWATGWSSAFAPSICSAETFPASRTASTALTTIDNCCASSLTRQPRIAHRNCSPSRNSTSADASDSACRGR
jgi:cupin superfamily protein